MPRQRVEQAGFLAVIAHEELADVETFARDAADADQKRAGARAAGEAVVSVSRKAHSCGRGGGNGAAR